MYEMYLDIDAVLPADDLSPVQWERDYFATGKS